MRKTVIFLAPALVLVMTGCVRSLHPLFTEQDLVFDSALLGTWTDKKTQDTWTFQQSGPQSYQLTLHPHEAGFLRQPGEPAGFEAHLVRLGEYLFLDTSPELPEIVNDFYNFHLIQSHVVSRILIEGDVLRIALLNSDWFEDKFAGGELDIATEKVNGIAAEKVDEGFVITASTRELQKFYEKYSEDTEAFPEPIELSRKI